MGSIQETIIHYLRDGRPVSLSEVTEKILSRKGATFVSVILETEPKMKKTNNKFYGKVKKISRISGIINFDYETAVNRRLEKEGKEPKFKAQQSWHRHIMVDGKPTSILINPRTQERYLKLQVRKQESIYTLNSVPINPAILTEFLYESSSYSNQNVGDPVKFITPKLSSIKSIAIDKEILNL